MIRQAVLLTDREAHEPTPPANRLRPRWRTTLGDVERRLMWAGCVACGASWLYAGLHASSSPELFLFLQATGAWLVALPTIREALWPAENELDEVHANRLVSLAALGSIWSGEYAAALVTPLVMRLGHWLESRGVPGRDDARESLRRLTTGPVTVVDEVTGEVRRAAAAEAGQLLSVRPGERFVADGIVEWGESTADESLVNGESLPRELQPGAKVLAGTANGRGAVRVRVTSTGDETLAGTMARDFDASFACRPRSLRWLERFTQWYVPVVGVAAAVAWAATGSGSRAAALLVSCCPCALALAGPAAMVAAISAAWRRGIVFRPNGRWETLADVRSVVLDKTGTITQGRLSVVAWRPLDAARPEGEVLATARQLASHSVHPVSCAIVEFVESQGEPPRAELLEQVHESSGGGVSAVAGDRTVRLGKVEWLAQQGVDCAADELRVVATHAGPAAVMAVDRTCAAYFLLADSVRESSRASLERLRTLGVSRLVMLTGDRAAAAHAAAAVLPLDEMRADCSPQAKCEAVRRERERTGSTAMVGDGANDALAMAASDVGIALDRADVRVAQGAADVVLLQGGLEGLPEAVELARRGRRLLFVNLLLAAGSTATLAVLAALGRLPTMTAAVVHNAGAAFVLIHSGWFVVREMRRRKERSNDSEEWRDAESSIH